MLVRLRQDVGAMTLARVLTLVIVAKTDTEADEAIEAANDASRQHPCRILALVGAEASGATRLDAQIRVGGDAGAGEVVVLRLHGALTGHGDSVLIPLLLADSPVVAWWPKDAPADVAQSAIGQMAQRRITDSAEAPDPLAKIRCRADTYQPGDTDLAWTRITLWRGLLAAALDQPPYEPVTAVVVAGAGDSASTDLLAGWLAYALKCPVTRVPTGAGTGLTSVRLERRSGNIDLTRPDGALATLTRPDQPVRRISLGRRELAECLADELRRLDPDEIYEETLTRGLSKIADGRAGATHKTAPRRIDQVRAHREPRTHGRRPSRQAAPGLRRSRSTGHGHRRCPVLAWAGRHRPHRRVDGHGIAGLTGPQPGQGRH
jgi:glucose-6-phosphate dehydrogenase assembly protein OpcA